MSKMSPFGTSSVKAAQALVFGAVLLSSTLAAQCSYPPGITSGDQERLDEMQPCFPSQANRGCCALNKSGNQTSDICLSNGLCLTQVEPWTGLILQNTCTDSNWGSDCPQVCPKSSYTEASAVHVLPCPHHGLNYWCCSQSGSDCCDQAFEISSMGTVMTASSTPTSSITGSTTVMATTTVTADHQAGQATSSGNGSKTAAVGAGVGAGLGACLLASLGMLLFQRRMYEKRLRDLKSLQTSPFAFPSMTHYASGPTVWPMELHGNHKSRVHEIDTAQHTNA